MTKKSKQPTATAFTRTQESWAKFVLEKIKADIEDQESWLTERGIAVEDFDLDDKLMKLYDEEFFFERYAVEMAEQRVYMRGKYGV